MSAMTQEEAPAAVLTSGAVASRLRLSPDTVLRIPRAALPYWTTPGGQRRYLEPDVEAYARDVLGQGGPAGG